MKTTPAQNNPSTKYWYAFVAGIETGVTSDGVTESGDKLPPESNTLSNTSSRRHRQLPINQLSMNERPPLNHPSNPRYQYPSVASGSNINAQRSGMPSSVGPQDFLQRTPSGASSRVASSTTRGGGHHSSAHSTTSSNFQSLGVTKRMAVGREGRKADMNIDFRPPTPKSSSAAQTPKKPSTASRGIRLLERAPPPPPSPAAIETLESDDSWRSNLDLIRRRALAEFQQICRGHPDMYHQGCNSAEDLYHLTIIKARESQPSPSTLNPNSAEKLSCSIYRLSQSVSEEMMRHWASISVQIDFDRSKHYEILKKMNSCTEAEFEILRNLNGEMILRNLRVEYFSRLKQLFTSGISQDNNSQTAAEMMNELLDEFKEKSDRAREQALKNLMVRITQLSQSNFNQFIEDAKIKATDLLKKSKGECLRKAVGLKMIPSEMVQKQCNSSFSSVSEIIRNSLPLSLSAREQEMIEAQVNGHPEDCSVIINEEIEKITNLLEKSSLDFQLALQNMTNFFEGSNTFTAEMENRLRDEFKKIRSEFSDLNDEEISRIETDLLLESSGKFKEQISYDPEIRYNQKFWSDQTLQHSQALELGFRTKLQEIQKKKILEHQKKLAEEAKRQHEKSLKVGETKKRFKEALEKQAGNILKREEELRNLKAKLAQEKASLENSLKDISEHKTRKEEIETQRAQAAAAAAEEKKALQKKLKEIAEKIQARRNTQKSEAMKVKDQLQEASEKFAEERASLERDLEAAMKSRTDLQEECAQQSAAVSESRKALDNFSAEWKEASERISKTRSELDQVKRLIKEASGTAAEKLKKRAELETAGLEKEKRISNSSKFLQQLEDSQNLISSEMQKFKEYLNSPAIHKALDRQKEISKLEAKIINIINQAEEAGASGPSRGRPLTQSLLEAFETARASVPLRILTPEDYVSDLRSIWEPRLENLKKEFSSSSNLESSISLKILENLVEDRVSQFSRLLRDFCEEILKSKSDGEIEFKNFNQKLQTSFSRPDFIVSTKLRSIQKSLKEIETLKNFNQAKYEAKQEIISQWYHLTMDIRWAQEETTLLEDQAGGVGADTTTSALVARKIEENARNILSPIVTGAGDLFVDGLSESDALRICENVTQKILSGQLKPTQELASMIYKTKFEHLNSYNQQIKDILGRYENQLNLIKSASGGGGGSGIGGSGIPLPPPPPPSPGFSKFNKDVHSAYNMLSSSKLASKKIGDTDAILENFTALKSEYDQLLKELVIKSQANLMTFLNSTVNHIKLLAKRKCEEARHEIEEMTRQFQNSSDYRLKWEKSVANRKLLKLKLNALSSIDTWKTEFLKNLASAKSQVEQSNGDTTTTTTTSSGIIDDTTSGIKSSSSSTSDVRSRLNFIEACRDIERIIHQHQDNLLKFNVDSDSLKSIRILPASMMIHLNRAPRPIEIDLPGSMENDAASAALTYLARVRWHLRATSKLRTDLRATSKLVSDQNSFKDAYGINIPWDISLLYEDLMNMPNVAETLKNIDKLSRARVREVNIPFLMKQGRGHSKTAHHEKFIEISRALERQVEHLSKIISEAFVQLKHNYSPIVIDRFLTTIKDCSTAEAHEWSLKQGPNPINTDQFFIDSNRYQLFEALAEKILDRQKRVEIARLLDIKFPSSVVEALESDDEDPRDRASALWLRFVKDLFKGEYRDEYKSLLCSSVEMQLNLRIIRANLSTLMEGHEVIDTLSKYISDEPNISWSIDPKETSEKIRDSAKYRALWTSYMLGIPGFEEFGKADQKEALRRWIYEHDYTLAKARVYNLPKVVKEIIIPENPYVTLVVACLYHHALNQWNNEGEQQAVDIPLTVAGLQALDYLLKKKPDLELQKLNLGINQPVEIDFEKDLVNQIYNIGALDTFWIDSDKYSRAKHNISMKRSHSILKSGISQLHNWLVKQQKTIDTTSPINLHERIARFNPEIDMSNKSGSDTETTSSYEQRQCDDLPKSISAVDLEQSLVHLAKKMGLSKCKTQLSS